MKFTQFGPEALAYRFVKPRSACKPLCGMDVAENGGRFTRPGIPALYLAQEAPTALAEYAQGDDRLDPAMLITYCLHLPRLADLSAGYDPEAWAPQWQHWNSDWRAARDEGREPASWQLGDELLEKGLCGLRFPSTKRKGGFNLLLLPDLLAEAERVEVHDTQGSLPKNGSSWD